LRAVLQRVSSAAVAVDGETIAAIGRGMLVLLGVATGDGIEDAERIARKLAEARVFPDDGGRFNRSVLDVGGEALVVSQFTLLADTRKGRRPSFVQAAPPDEAEPLVERVVQSLRERGVPTQTGRFGAHMHVSLVNDGPVTLIFES
jgi:D-tyrosyl-tRNA(Tyr) deacylase